MDFPLPGGVLAKTLRTSSLSGGLAALALALLAPVHADVKAPSGRRSLGTLVNGKRGGRCAAGLCVVSGGTAAGSNLFHRLSALDTRGAVRGIQFQNQRNQTVVVGVTNAFGSWIDKTIEFSKPGDLLLLSPGGIHLGAGAGFRQINQLGLSTATRLAMQGGGAFDVFGSTAFNASGLTGAPRFNREGLQVDLAARQAAGITAVPGIVAEGIEVSVDRELLLDAQDGVVQVDANSVLQASERIGLHGSTVSVAGSLLSSNGLKGGEVTLEGETVALRETAKVVATGEEAGGLIQLGGSWQNSNPSVRQAVHTEVLKGAIVDASATRSGDGGTIVVWSDVTNPQSVTKAYGTFIAEGGRFGGHGGRIETSGFGLDVSGIEVSTRSADGMSGLWLL
ncbi:MAG: hypothetical protein EBZ24_13850, partial [Synechococcaceae bacterium WB9_4xB_025]|nr:hypothetical protein [Synechococcaceae bacterium WB9_4xB_025]